MVGIHRVSSVARVTGIHPIEQQREMGSVAVNASTKSAVWNVSLNLLRVLDSALSGLTCQQLAREPWPGLLLALEEFEKDV